MRECFQDLRIAVVSGSQRRSDILLALANGVNGYIPKSMGAAEIPRALELVLDGMIYVPPSLAEISPADEEVKVADPDGAAAEPLSLGQLTPRQRDVLELLVQGRSNKEIASGLRMRLWLPFLPRIVRKSPKSFRTRAEDDARDGKAEASASRLEAARSP